MTTTRQEVPRVTGLSSWQRGSIVLNGHEVGGTRSQGSGRYTHRAVRHGLALVPQTGQMGL